MKKTLTILFFCVNSLISSSQEVSWELHNDSLFMKRGNDSVYYNQYMFFDFIVSLKQIVINAEAGLATKQNTLVSGTNIKTVNGSSVLGSGDLVVSSAAAFSSITGQPTDNSNLSTALNNKLATNGNGSSLTGLTASQVGLGNVTNESKATMFANPSFSGTPTGIGIPVYARVTGSNVTTTGQSLTNITGLSFPLTTNAIYEFEVVLSVSTSAVTTGTAYGLNYSVAGATIEASITGSSTSTASKTLRINALNTATCDFD